MFIEFSQAISFEIGKGRPAAAELLDEAETHIEELGRSQIGFTRNEE